MVTARIAGLSPGTSPPPVRIPIRPFLVLMRPLCRFLRACKRKIDGSYWMCKRRRSEPRVSLLAIYHKRLTMHEPRVLEWRLARRPRGVHARRDRIPRHEFSIPRKLVE